jgi:hypothetical protein
LAGGGARCPPSTLEEILTVNKRKMLKGYGQVCADHAEKHVKAQYKRFDKERRAEWKVKALAELNAGAKALPRQRKKKSA